MTTRSSGPILSRHALAALERMRGNVDSARTILDGGLWGRCIDQLAALEDGDMLGAFLGDARRHWTEGADYSSTRRAFIRAKDNVLVSVLGSAYYPTLGLEYLVFDERSSALDRRVREHYSPPVRAALPRQSSAGLEPGNVVAIFSEHFATRAQPDDEFQTIYFPQKFIDRLHAHTKPIVMRCLADGCLEYLRKALRDGAADDFCSARVILHDAAHRSGRLPLPTNVRRKSFREYAAIEELRADLTAIKLGFRALGESVGGTMAEYILSQRLFYGIVADPNEDYDALSSHILLLRLEKCGAIYQRHSQIVIDLERVLEESDDLLAEITDIEDATASLSYAETRNFVRPIVHHWAGANPATMRYERCGAAILVRKTAFGLSG